MRITSEGLTCSQLVDCLHVRLSGRELIMKNVRTPWLVALAAGTVFAGSALAQPAVFDDLGNIDPVAGTTLTRTGLSTTTSGDTAVVWFKFTLTAPTTYANLRHLSIWNLGTGDTEFTLFDSTGAIRSVDDDDGPGVQSSISYGSGDGQFPNGGTGTPLIGNGRDLELQPGVYWLGVAHYANDATAGWTYEATTQTATGPWDLNVSAGTIAAPAPTVAFTDLGTLGASDTITRTGESMGASEVKWFKINVPGAVRSLNTFLDIDTEGSALAPTNATRLSIYTALGAYLGYTDTTDGSNSLSQLTFGDDAPVRPAVGNGLAYNGRDAATFPAGTYYIAVAAPGVAPSTTGATGASWGHTSTSTNSGTFNLRITNVPLPTPPSGTGSVTGCLRSDIGGTGNIRVNAVPGVSPTSVSLTVSVDASVLGLGTVSLFDDGTNGDDLAGDLIFNRAVTVAGPLTAGANTMPFTVTDELNRSTSANINFTVSTAPTGGESLEGAVIPSGNPGDALSSISGNFEASRATFHKIQICDPATFSASTVGGTTVDTQLFLFSEQGLGVAVNDDHVGGTTLQSTITNLFVTAPGTYYLAVVQYNRDPVSDLCANTLIFANLPFRSERAPDGPGAASPIAGWSGAPAVTPSTAAYTIALTGACVPGTVAGCDDIDFNNNDVFPEDADVIDFFNVLAGAECPACNDIDFNNNGVFPEDADVIDFFNVLAGGECP